jgi:hypothetical protein
MKKRQIQHFNLKKMIFFFFNDLIFLTKKMFFTIFLMKKH